MTYAKIIYYIQGNSSNVLKLSKVEYYKRLVRLFHDILLLCIISRFQNNIHVQIFTNPHQINQSIIYMSSIR